MATHSGILARESPGIGGDWGLLSAVVHRPLTAAASLVAEQRL